MSIVVLSCKSRVFSELRKTENGTSALYPITHKMNQPLLKIVIPKPCSEDWEGMQRNETGRHCTSCNKTVLDFSLLTDSEVQNYFLNNQHKETCGRFRNSQLERIRIHIPNYLFQKKLPKWKFFLIVLLICFGSSLLPVDFVVNGGSGLYAQAHINNDGQKKKHTKSKKKRNRKRASVYEFLPIHELLVIPEVMISGFIQTIPEETKPPAILESTLMIAGKNVIPDELVMSAKKSTNDERSNRKPLKKEKDKNKTEFLVAKRIRLRRKKKTSL